MNNIIKSFFFEAENIRLELHIKKEVFKGALKMYIDANLESKNPDITIHHSTNISSKNFSLLYLGNNTRCRGFAIRDIYLPRKSFAKNLQPIISEYEN